MGQQEAFSEAVIIFEGSEIAEEMLFADFEACLEGRAVLESFAASVISGMYLVIGSELSIRGVVCFRVAIDENGVLDPSFSVPLRHLASVAGAGPDLGAGPIRLASRSQCPVSWHAHNLWEPEGDGGANPLNVAQSAVRRNSLGYDKVSQQSADAGFGFDVLDENGDGSFEFPDPGTSGTNGVSGLILTLDDDPLIDESPVPPNEPPPPPDEPSPPTNASARPAKEPPATPPPESPPRATPPPAPPSRAAPPTAARRQTNGASKPGAAMPPSNGAHLTNGDLDDPFKRHSQEMLQRKIERTFGADGTVSLQKLIVQHSEQLDALTAKYRRDLEQQQQVYLDQIRGCRDEIQKLKSELRHEQTRNQRLQQLLRGET